MLADDRREALADLRDLLSRNDQARNYTTVLKLARVQYRANELTV